MLTTFSKPWHAPVLISGAFCYFIDGFAGSPIYFGLINQNESEVVELLTNNLFSKPTKASSNSVPIGVDSDGTLIMRTRTSPYVGIHGSHTENFPSFSAPMFGTILTRGKFQLAELGNSFFLFKQGSLIKKIDLPSTPLRFGLSAYNGEISTVLMNKQEHYTLNVYSPRAQFHCATKALKVRSMQHLFSRSDFLENLTNSSIVTLAESFDGRNGLHKQHFCDVITINTISGEIKTVAKFSDPAVPSDTGINALQSSCCIARSANQILVLRKEGIYEIAR